MTYNIPDWLGYNPNAPYLDTIASYSNNMAYPDGPVGVEMPDGTIHIIEDWTNHTYDR